jgi:Fe-S-cluster containining protein
MDVRVLSFHAGYRCANAGACCTSNWPIPIETDRHARLKAALASAELLPIAGPAASAFQARPDLPPEAAALLATSHGRCVFHDPAGRCAIHSALGHDALPLACRQFPRVSVIDPRGVSVTLSHYCPTAALLLDRECGGTVLVNTSAFPASGEYVGLDARTALPPLLRPGLLMDWESWWELEALAVQALLVTPGSASDALARVREAVRRLLVWRPDDGPLIHAVREAFGAAETAEGASSPSLVTLALNAVPDVSRGAAEWSGTVITSDTALRRFLAAHAFANWTIHLGQGLMAWVRSIEAALAFIDAGAGVRHTDLVLRHLIDPKAFADALS